MQELAERSIRGFGEMLGALKAWGVAGDNPWFDAAIAPTHIDPYCVWTTEARISGRAEDASIATPCLGAWLGNLDVGGRAMDIETPPLRVLAQVNERAYGQADDGVFSMLMSRFDHPRAKAYGLREGRRFVCVAMGLCVEDDLSIHYVATEARYRRTGLASRLLLAMMHQAREEGLRSATLQASADGLSVYECLGFLRVATLRGFLRPPTSPSGT